MPIIWRVFNPGGKVSPSKRFDLDQSHTFVVGSPACLLKMREKMAQKARTMWVIFAGAQEIGRPGTRYIALDGTVTREKKLAATFSTYGDAEEFAQSKNIKLDGATRYIGHDDFPESDI